MASCEEFLDRLGARWSGGEGQQSVPLVFVRLEGMNDVRRRYGSPAADRVMVGMAHRLRAHLRRDDTVVRFLPAEVFILLAGEVSEDGSRGFASPPRDGFAVIADTRNIGPDPAQLEPKTLHQRETAIPARRPLFAYRSVGALCAAALSHAPRDLLVAERVTALGDEFNARTNEGQPLEYRLPAYKELGGRLGVGPVISGLEAIVGYWDAGALTIVSQTAVNAAIRNLLDPFVERISAIEEPATNT